MLCKWSSFVGCQVRLETQTMTDDSVKGWAKSKTGNSGSWNVWISIFIWGFMWVSIFFGFTIKTRLIFKNGDALWQCSLVNLFKFGFTFCLASWWWWQMAVSWYGELIRALRSCRIKVETCKGAVPWGYGPMSPPYELMTSADQFCPPVCNYVYVCAHFSGLGCRFLRPPSSEGECAERWTTVSLNHKGHGRAMQPKSRTMRSWGKQCTLQNLACT